MKTPETDEQLALQKPTIPWSDVVPVDFARRLEDERDTARVVAADAIRELERVISTGDTDHTPLIVGNLKEILGDVETEIAAFKIAHGNNRNTCLVCPVVVASRSSPFKDGFRSVDDITVEIGNTQVKLPNHKLNARAGDYLVVFLQTARRDDPRLALCGVNVPPIPGY